MLLFVLEVLKFELKVEFIARKGYFTANSLVAMVTKSVVMVNQSNSIEFYRQQLDENLSISLCTMHRLWLRSYPLPACAREGRPATECEVSSIPSTGLCNKKGRFYSLLFIIT